MACRQACNCLRAKSLGSRGVSSVVNGGGNYVSRRARKQEQRQLVVGVPIVVGSVTARRVRRKQIARSGMLSFSSDNRQNDWGDKEHNTVSSSSSSLSSETAPNSSVDNDAAAPDGLVGSKSGSRGQAKAAAGGGEEAAASKAASQAENAVENSPLYDAIRARLDNRKKKRKGTDVKTPREVPRIELKERRHMVEVVNLASVRKGKFFDASTELISAKLAQDFPPLEASSLSGKTVRFPGVLKGGVSLVGVFHRGSGFQMMSSWLEPFEEAFGIASGSQSVVAGQPKVPKVIQLSLIDSWLMKVLKTLAVSGMAKGVPDDKRDTFFFRFGKTEELQKNLDIRSRVSLDLYLVDEMARVRWRGNGHGTPSEIESMIRCARELVAGDDSVDGAGSRGKLKDKRGGGRPRKGG
ncbi:unnamed protein product [Sphacelaria rigidula]